MFKSKSQFPFKMKRIWIVAWLGFQLSCFLLLMNFLQKQGGLKLSKHPVLIILSYDGFRYDYLHKVDTPHLDFVKSHGVFVPYMQSQFATFTFPNHHTMTTGLHIESHGIVANSFYDPLYGQVLHGADDDPRYWNYSSHVLPLYALNELAGDNRFSGVHQWAGSSQPYGHKQILSTHLKKFDADYPFESRIDDVIEWITHPEKPANLVFIYFPEPDLTAHGCGPNSVEVADQISRMDRITGYLLTKLRTLNIMEKVNLIFTSDHGMQEIRQDKPESFIDISKILDNEEDKLFVNYGSTPVLQLLPNDPNQTEEIYNVFKNASKNLNFSAYLKEQTITDHPKWHYQRSRRIMPILLVADPGFTFDKPNFDSKKCAIPAVGHHGFDHADPQMYPYFMAIGPLFKGNGAVEKPFQNVDIYPLVKYIMKLPEHLHNGSFVRICPILRDKDVCELYNLKVAKKRTD